jgi:hypothetical protein
MFAHFLRKPIPNSRVFAFHSQQHALGLQVHKYGEVGTRCVIKSGCYLGVLQKSVGVGKRQAERAMHAKHYIDKCLIGK